MRRPHVPGAGEGPGAPALADVRHAALGGHFPLKKEFQNRLAEAESRIQQLEALPDESAKRIAVDAIQALLALHGDGLAQTVRLLEERGQDELINQLAEDEVVGGLLLLHGLHPQPLETRVRQALDKVRPYLASHGGDVELLEVEEGSVSLRLKGSCDGCPSSAMTLKYAIEQAITDAAPDVMEIEVAGVTATAPMAGFVPLSQIRPAERGATDGDWQDVRGLQGLRPSEVRALRVNGLLLVFCRLGDSWYAYRDACPACAGSLEGAAVEAVILTCPSCGRRFDVRHAGRCIDDQSLHLEPIPLLIEGGTVRVAIPAPATP
jgi:Fe-S cluster biogenesis protein NfuA/nitrite reductase/ring-hydroxylating ferredoxin subunit